MNKLCLVKALCVLFLSVFISPLLVADPPPGNSNDPKEEKKMKEQRAEQNKQVLINALDPIITGKDQNIRQIKEIGENMVSGEEKRMPGFHKQADLIQDENHLSRKELESLYVKWGEKQYEIEKKQSQIQESVNSLLGRYNVDMGSSDFLSISPEKIVNQTIMRKQFLRNDDRLDLINKVRTLQNTLRPDNQEVTNLLNENNKRLEQLKKQKGDLEAFCKDCAQKVQEILKKQAAEKQATETQKAEITQ